MHVKCLYLSANRIKVLKVLKVEETMRDVAKLMQESRREGQVTENELTLNKLDEMYSWCRTKSLHKGIMGHVFFLNIIYRALNKRRKILLYYRIGWEGFDGN